VTFSLCVHEPYVDDGGTDQHRFGVAVTTRLVGVGTLCPFASADGAVATQSLVNVELGRKGLAYLADGLAVADALEALMNADDGTENRQLHGVDSGGSFTFSGEECKPWYGHHDGSDAVSGHYTGAGNLLTGEETIEAVVDTYESTAPPAGEAGQAGVGDDDVAPLPERLVEALAAERATTAVRKKQSESHPMSTSGRRTTAPGRSSQRRRTSGRLPDTRSTTVTATGTAARQRRLSTGGATPNSATRL
jgi:uncharacterized Ntn-hydrolase superfamily protein